MRVSEDLKSFQESLEQISQTQIDATTWTVTGYESIIAEAKTLLEEAEELIVCSLWRHEADILSESLLKAHKRNVKVITFSLLLYLSSQAKS